MELKELKDLSKNNELLLNILEQFEDKKIYFHSGKWDFELHYGTEICTECGCEYHDECECDKDNEDIGIFCGCVVKYIDEDGEIIYEEFGEELDEFQGTRLQDKYNIFFDDILEEIHVFEFKNLCDGVVEGFYTFDDFIRLNV